MKQLREKGSYVPSKLPVTRAIAVLIVFMIGFIVLVYIQECLFSGGIEAISCCM